MIEKYYENKKARELMFQFLENRELSLGSDKGFIRGISLRKLNFFDYWWFKEFIDYRKNKMYISCAKYNFIPLFTNDLRERSSETVIWFNNTARNSIISFDMLFDFDKKDNDIDSFYNELYAFQELLINEKITFYIVFSGKNFHFIIPNVFSEWNENIMNFLKNFYLQLKERFKLKYVDLVGTDNFSKIRKLPYSISDNKVCKVLVNIDEYFNNKKCCDIDYFLENINEIPFYNEFVFNLNEINNTYFNLVKFCNKFNIEV